MLKFSFICAAQNCIVNLFLHGSDAKTALEAAEIMGVGAYLFGEGYPSPMFLSGD